MLCLLWSELEIRRRPLSQTFHAATNSWGNESLAMTLLFSRAEIILFSTESSSFNEVRQLLSEGPSLKSWQRLRNDDSFPNDPRLEIQN